MWLSPQTGHNDFRNQLNEQLGANSLPNIVQLSQPLTPQMSEGLAVTLVGLALLDSTLQRICTKSSEFTDPGKVGVGRIRDLLVSA